MRLKKNNLQKNFKDNTSYDLRKLGLNLTSGLKFGGDYLGYLGDPDQSHATFIILCLNNPDGEISMLSLVMHARLATNVNKILVLAFPRCISIPSISISAFCNTSRFRNKANKDETKHCWGDNKDFITPFHIKTDQSNTSFKLHTPKLIDGGNDIQNTGSEKLEYLKLNTLCCLDKLSLSPKQPLSLSSLYYEHPIQHISSQMDLPNNTKQLENLQDDYSPVYICLEWLNI